MVNEGKGRILLRFCNDCIKNSLYNFYTSIACSAFIPAASVFPTAYKIILYDLFVKISPFNHSSCIFCSNDHVNAAIGVTIALWFWKDSESLSLEQLN